MKILILGPNQGKRYNWGHQLFKNEIARQHDVRFYGEGYKEWDSAQTNICSIMHMLQFDPDVVLSYMGKYCKWVSGMAEIDIPKVHIVIDYFPWNYAEEDIYIRATKQDLVFAVCQHEVRALKINGHTMPIRQLPFSVDTNVFRHYGQSRILDASAAFSVVKWAYPNRSAIIDCLCGMILDGYAIKAQSSWPKTRIWHQDYVYMLGESKIAVNGVDCFRSLNWKFLEPCACGTMLLTEEAEDMEQLGFRDKINCVAFCGLSDMREKIEYYCKQNEERKSIAKKGQELIRECHSVTCRVSGLSNVIGLGLGIAY